MKLLFIYGPPAAGKLTVGQELAGLTGFRLFHNHLTIELAREIFPNPSESRSRLISSLRLAVLEEAAKSEVSTIFTFVYEAKEDDEFVDEVVDTISRYGGEVIFVQLNPRREVLLARVKGDSRSKYSKISDSSALEEIIDRHDLSTPMQRENHFSIDNSGLSPREVALQIIARAQLQEK